MDFNYVPCPHQIAAGCGPLWSQDAGIACLCGVMLPVVADVFSNGAYLGRLRAVPVADYLSRVEGDAYPYRTAEAMVLSLHGVEHADRSGRCRRLMGLVAVLAEAGISRRLLHLAAEGDVPGMDAAAGVLAEASLVGFSVDDAVAAHRLVMRERLVADGTLRRSPLRRCR